MEVWDILIINNPWHNGLTGVRNKNLRRYCVTFIKNLCKFHISVLINFLHVKNKFI